MEEKKPLRVSPPRSHSQAPPSPPPRSPLSSVTSSPRRQTSPTTSPTQAPPKSPHPLMRSKHSMNLVSGDLIKSVSSPQAHPPPRAQNLQKHKSPEISVHQPLSPVIPPLRLSSPQQERPFRRTKAVNLTREEQDALNDLKTTSEPNNLSFSLDKSSSQPETRSRRSVGERAPLPTNYERKLDLSDGYSSPPPGDLSLSPPKGGTLRGSPVAKKKGILGDSEAMLKDLWSGTLKRSTSPSPSRKGVSNIFSEPIGEHLDLEGSGSNSPLLTPISPKSGKKKPKTLGRKSGKKASPLSPLQSDISLSFTKDLSEKFIHVDVGGAGGGETAPLPRGDCFTPNGDPTNISILEMREQANEKVEGKYFQSRLERLLDALKAKNGGQLNPCPCITASIVPRVCDESNIPVKLQLTNGSTTSMFVAGNITIGELFTRVLPRLKKEGIEGKSGEEWMLKMPGKEEFVLDSEQELGKLQYVHDCVAKKMTVLFHMLPRIYKPTPSPPVFPLILMSDGDVGLETKEIQGYWSKNVNVPLSLRILLAQNFDNWESSLRKRGKKTEEKMAGVLLECSLYHGNLALCKRRSGLSDTGAFMETIRMIDVSNLPLTSRLCFTLWGYSNSKKASSSRLALDLDLGTVDGFSPLGWTNFNLFEFDGRLRAGSHTLRLWPDQACNPMGASTQNLDRTTANFTIIIPSAPHPIYFQPPSYEAGKAVLYKKRRRKDEGEEWEKAIWKSELSPRGGPKTGAGIGGSRGLVAVPHHSPMMRVKKESSEKRTGGGLGSPRSGCGELCETGVICLCFRPNEAELSVLQKVIDSDPFALLEKEEKTIVWKARAYMMKHSPETLPKVLISADWTNLENSSEAYRLLEKWPPIGPLVALQLLDARFSDPYVRQYAVGCLTQMTDLELEYYMLQLVQTLKHEAYDVSALCFFLFLRSVHNPRLLGHTLFWFLESERDDEKLCDRFRLFKKLLLLSFDEAFRNEMLKQSAVVRQFVTMAKQIKEIKEREKRDEALRTSLQSFTMEDFGLPLNPRIRTRGLIIPQCKTMQSATVPLFLTFKNADDLGGDIRVIFKVGDDLRQDILTLQTIQVIDRLWKEANLSLFVTPYRVVATGANAGMIEVVPDSKTTADIHKECGGGALGALKEEVLWTYLKGVPTTKDNENLVRERFALSCAAYCVITYVMGIGDRHNDNIMLTSSGDLFHIDFGFIFGNYLKFIGIERETTPFVLTREMVYVMGGQNSSMYQTFVTTCCKAYVELRKNSHLFLALFSMMLSTGIPDLQKVEDLSNFKEAMRPGITDQEAEKEFEELIKKSLKNTRVYFNNIAHILANG